MKKLFLVASILALAVMLIPSAVFAAGPTVINISGLTDRLGNGVTGSFTAGTLNWNIDSTTGTHVATTTMNVDGANLAVLSNGFDTTSWHPGVVGEINGFNGQGGYTGTYSTQTNGNYGILGSFINASSKAGGADFVLLDTQNFNIMSGNHEYDVVGTFAAHASGNNDQVAMNLKSVGSMYVWSEATNPYSGPALRGSVIEKESTATKGGTLMADLYMGVNTDGIATINNSNIWGFGNSESGTLCSTNYGGGTRSVTATGTGQYNQNGFGATQLNYNGFTFVGPSTATTTASFSGGMSGNYTMDAK